MADFCIMKTIIFLSVVYYTFAVPVEDDPLQEFINGNQKFSSAVYKELSIENSDNFIVSPLSAEVVLALTNEGARGDTSKELISGLSLPTTKEKIQEALKSFLPSLKIADDELKLLSANKIYTAKDLKLSDDFKSTATGIYDAGVESVDFSENVETSAKINKWVEENTNSKIKNLIQSDSIDGSTRIVLVNAIYFSGEWISKFEKEKTEKKRFFITKAESVETDTMRQVNFFNYYESPTLGAKFLELLYKGENISMTIVLPNEKDGLTNLEQNIDQVLASQQFSWESVDIELPKFTIESSIQFVPILKKTNPNYLVHAPNSIALQNQWPNMDRTSNSVGVNKLFSSDADLSGLSSADMNAIVSDVIQKAFIKVDEFGTEAAAATAVVRKLSSPITYLTKTYEFHADHPFLYVIKLNGAVLFAGRYVNPTEGRS